MKFCLDCPAIISTNRVRCVACADKRLRKQKAKWAQGKRDKARFDRDKGVGKMPVWGVGKVVRLPIQLQRVPSERLEDAIAEMLKGGGA